MRSAMGRLASLQPTNEAGLNRYQRVMITAWRHSLQVELPATNDLFSVKGATKRYPAYQATEVAIGRRGRNDRINATLFEPVAATKKTLVILANPDGQKAFVNIGPVASGLASALVQKGLSVLVVDVYRAGDAKVTELDQFKNYFNAYNRTVCQERVQDLITACGYGVLYNKASKVVLCGTGRAGLYAMLAAPAADAVVADCDQLDYTRNELLMKPDLFYPGLKRFGGFEGMALLAAPNPLFLFNSGERFPYRSLESSYAVVKKGSDFKRQSTPATDDAITEWIQNL